MYRWVRERHMIGIRGRNFLEAPWAGGVVLLGCVIVAMLLANLPGTSLYYRHLLETDLSLMVHSFRRPARPSCLYWRPQAACSPLRSFSCSSTTAP